MSLLWVHAAKWGEPNDDYLHDVHHDYLRAHYNDTPEGIADPHLHDHYVPLNHARPDGPKTMVQARHCPGWEPGTCTHKFTQSQMKDIAGQKWEVEHDRLLDPEAHEKRQRENQHAADSFLSDYKLDHPDRVFKVHPEMGELMPNDDPRLGS